MKDRSSWTHNQKIGEWGEDIAQRFLEEKGYQLLDRNWRVGHKEVDLIFTNGNAIIFVEVKTRIEGDSHQVGTSITPDKIRFLVQSANSYIRQKGYHQGIRFDLIYITIRDLQAKDYQIEHIEKAFYPPLNMNRDRKSLR